MYISVFFKRKFRIKQVQGKEQEKARHSWEKVKLKEQVEHLGVIVYWETLRARSSEALQEKVLNS